MFEDLIEEYPEAGPYIRRAVEEHGEEWVLDNYYREIYPLGVVMSVPEKEELPFYDADEHDTMTDAELREMYESWAEYRENLRMASDAEGDDGE